MRFFTSATLRSLVYFAGRLHAYDLFFYKYKLFIMFYHAHLIQLLLIHCPPSSNSSHFFFDVVICDAIISRLFSFTLFQQHSFYMLNYYYHHQRCRRSCRKTSTWRAKSK